MTQIEKYVIDRVTKFRLERGLSQREFGDNINLSQAFIKDVENPKKRAKYNLNHLNEIVKVFECKFSDFLPDDGI